MELSAVFFITSFLSELYKVFFEDPQGGAFPARKEREKKQGKKISEHKTHPFSIK